MQSGVSTARRVFEFNRLKAVSGPDILILDSRVVGELFIQALAWSGSIAKTPRPLK
jgi:hypothetical protein